MRNRKTSSLVAFVISLGLLSACGSDGSSITKPEFIAKANAICTEYDKAFEEKTAELTSDATEEQVLAFVTDVMIPEFENMIGEIRDIGFPEADEALLDGLMDETDVELEKLKQDPATILTAEESPFASIDSRLTDYGLTVCGED